MTGDPTRPPTEAERLLKLVEAGKVQMPLGYSCDPRGIVYHEHRGGEAWDPCNYDSFSCLDRQNIKLPEGERVNLTKVPLRVSCDCRLYNVVDTNTGRRADAWLSPDDLGAYERGELHFRIGQTPEEEATELDLIARFDAKRLGKGLPA